ncbi:MAG: sigma-70 family RNA polymerase sigma factor [Sedimentisphaerales bacterium]|nr:sigma-70 family RNA polymerase sigma factor [Sedimentisphaerales bacterium]
MLIRRFNAGDTQALRRIYEKYWTDLLSVARALAGDPAQIEDVVQDVIVGFASQAGRFALKGSLKGYLAICVANRARNVSRQGRQVDPERLVRARCEPAQQPDGSKAAEDVEQRRILTAALEQLPEEQRDAVVLHVLSSLPFREIARQTGVSINTVQSRYRYGLQKLQTLLNGQVEP